MRPVCLARAATTKPGSPPAPEFSSRLSRRNSKPATCTRFPVRLSATKETRSSGSCSRICSEPGLLRPLDVIVHLFLQNLQGQRAVLEHRVVELPLIELRPELILRAFS